MKRRNKKSGRTPCSRLCRWQVRPSTSLKNLTKGGGLNPLFWKGVFVTGREIIPGEDILLRHEASNKCFTLLFLDNNGAVSIPSTNFIQTPPKPSSNNTQTERKLSLPLLLSVKYLPKKEVYRGVTLSERKWTCGGTGATGIICRCAKVVAWLVYTEW